MQSNEFHNGIFFLHMYHYTMFSYSPLPVPDGSPYSPSQAYLLSSYNIYVITVSIVHPP